MHNFGGQRKHCWTFRAPGSRSQGDQCLIQDTFCICIPDMITAACLQTDVFTNLEQPDLDHSICGHGVYEDVNYIL